LGERKTSKPVKITSGSLSKYLGSINNNLKIVRENNTMLSPERESSSQKIMNTT